MRPCPYLAPAFMFLLVFNISTVHAAWSEPKEIISGKWGAGAGQFGMRSEGGYSVLPSIEAVTAERHVIVSDPVNRKQMVFSGEGKLIMEQKWDAVKAIEGKAIAPLPQKDREAIIVRSMKITANTYRVTIVFADKNVVLDSEQDFKIAGRDVNGFVYGIAMDSIIRFDKNGKKTAVLSLPRGREELVPFPGHAPRGVYIEYGEPVIAPNGDVYLGKISEAAYRILRWTWQ